MFCSLLLQPSPNPREVKVRESLTPCPEEGTMAYRVHSGDTLTKIAARFHTSVGALAKANGIRNVNLIFTGQMLKVPGKSDSFQTAPKKTTKTTSTPPAAAKAGKFGPKAAHLANVA